MGEVKGAPGLEPTKIDRLGERPPEAARRLK